MGSCNASRLAAIAVLAASLLVTVSAVQYIQDEYLWTKGTWRDYKLTFPLQHFGFNQPVAHADAAEPAAMAAGAASNATGAAKAGESATAKEAGSGQKPEALRLLPAEVSTPELEAAVKGYEGVSLRGAVRPTSGAGLPHEGMKPASGSPLKILETDAAVPKAAAVIECQVCQHFAEEVWKGLVQWLLRGPGQPLSRQRLIKYLPEICQWEVPQVFLREHVIMEGLLKLGERAPSDDRSGADAPPGTLVSVSRRHEEVTKIHELRAVRLACSNILAPLQRQRDAEAKADGAVEAPADAKEAAGEAASAAAKAAAAKAEDAKAIVSAFTDALEHMVMELEHIPGLGYPSGQDNAIQWSSDEDDGPALHDSCQDHHPGCVNWAKWGECERNPKYMMGFEEWPGNCKMSCGACTPPAHVRNRFLSEKTSAALLRAADTVVSKLERRLCSEAPPCQGSVARLLEREFVNMRGAARGLDGFRTDEHGVQHPLQATRWPASRVVLVRRASEALTGRPEVPAPLSEDAQQPLQPEQAMARALHDRCLYADAGWWSYELCWQLHLRQFHVPAGGSIRRVESARALGIYDAAESQNSGRAENGEMPTLPAQHLLEGTAGSRVPYFRHSYTRGAACHVPGEGEVPRSAEVRAACSPDGATHFVMHEPSPCAYVAVLHTPVLCGLPGFQPDWTGLAALPVLHSPGSAETEMGGVKAQQLAASVLAEVAEALGMPGLQFSFIGEPQPAAGEDAAAAVAEAGAGQKGAGEGADGRQDSGTAATAAATTTPGEAAAVSDLGDDSSKPSPVDPSSDADGDARAAEPQQPAPDQDASSDHTEL